ncbi:hypothetical protein GCM10027174_30070 [Salinifilum aidingensis]
MLRVLDIEQPPAQRLAFLARATLENPRLDLLLCGVAGAAGAPKRDGEHAGP